MPSVDDEINQLNVDLKKRLNLRDAPKSIADLQFSVLSAHSSLEKKLEERILNQLEIEIPKERLVTWRAIDLWSNVLMTSLSFMNKLDIVNRYRDADDGLYKKCRKLNGFRNEFAHSSSEDLSKKYNKTSADGKQNLRNLLRNLNDCLSDFDNYLSDSHKTLMKEQRIVLESREGIEEAVVDMKNYKRLKLNTPLKRLTLLRTEDHSDALGDFVLSRGLYIKMGKNGKPTNELLNSTLIMMSEMSDLVEFEDLKS